MGINFQILMLIFGLQCVQNSMLPSNSLSNQSIDNNSEDGQHGIKKNRTSSELKKLLFGDELNVECGRSLTTKNESVIGARGANISEFPWQVSIQLKRHLSENVCGGAVIGKRWILTAAHCALSSSKSKDILVVLGATNLSQSHVQATVDLIAIHPGFNRQTFQHDIALLRTNEPIDLSGRSHSIVPVCLPETSDEEPVGTAIFTGFGNSSILRAIEVPLLELEACKSYYGDMVYPTMFCGGFKESGYNTCYGDGGGPLVQYKNNHGIFIGIVSFGRDCRNPGVNTKVASYIDWIYNTIEKNQ